MFTPSLVPRLCGRRERGLVYSACTCVSIPRNLGLQSSAYWAAFSPPMWPRNEASIPQVEEWGGAHNCTEWAPGINAWMSDVDLWCFT